MVKILITGNGFVSKNLQKNLIDHEIFVYDKKNNIEEINSFSPNIIFHTAAELCDSNKMFDSNVKLTYDLLECIKTINFKSFIYIGSSSEYGKMDRPINEKDVINPRTIYEGTKGCGTLLCQSYARTYNKPIIIVRPFSLYGRFDVERKIIPTLYRCFTTEEKLKLVEDSVHDWLHIDDFIQGLLFLVFSKLNTDTDIVNFGTGIQTSNLEIFNIFKKIFKKSIAYEKVLGIRSYDSNTNWVCDTSYATFKYGFKCQYSLEKGLKQYINERLSSS